MSNFRKIKQHFQLGPSQWSYHLACGHSHLSGTAPVVWGEDMYCTECGKKKARKKKCKPSINALFTKTVGGKMKYEVIIDRTAIRTASFVVEANCLADAENKAIDLAYDYDFAKCGESEAWYEVSSTQEAK